MFLDKELTLFAASLSFYTLLTIVPLLFVIVTIASTWESFSGYYTNIESLLYKNLLPGNPKIVIKYLNEFLHNSAKMSMLSSIFLFILSLFFFKHYEYVVSKIFKTKNRNFLDSFGIYIIILTITPISLGFAFYLSGHLTVLMASNSLTEELNNIKYIPYLITWVLFFILFKFSANTQVSFRAALNTSLLVSVVFNMAKNAFVYYVFYNKAYATIYGSLSILLFLFLWIYLSWLIFIYGLKLCHIINEIYKDKDTISQK